MRIAFFTALKEERQAVRQAWPMDDSGSLMAVPFDSGDRAVGFCTGVGAERMTSAVELALRALTPDLAVLVGFSAGLRGDMAVGEVICEESGDPALVALLREFPIPLRFGRVAACGFLHTAQDKSRLAAERPDCLVADLETEAFISTVGAAGVPYIVLRAVSDDLHTSLPLRFDELLTSRGFPDELAIARRLVGQPSLLPRIWKLAQASNAAQTGLRDTLRDIKPLLIRRLSESA